MSEPPLPTLELTRWAREWAAARTLTYDLLRSLPYPVMNFSPHPDFGTFARQMRHLGDIQSCYVRAIHSGAMDFSGQQRQRALEQSKEDLEAYLRHVDEELSTTLAGLTGEQLDRSIAWESGPVSLLEHLLRLLQHEVLHQGMWTIYARVADLPLPESWTAVWGFRFP